MMEPLRLQQIQTAPRRIPIDPQLHMWCTPLTDAVAQFDGGDLVISDSQVRVRISLTPTLTRMVRQGAHLEARFRDGDWRVTGRREVGLEAILTLEPERG